MPPGIAVDARWFPAGVFWFRAACSSRQHIAGATRSAHCAWLPCKKSPMIWAIFRYSRIYRSDAPPPAELRVCRQFTPPPRIACGNSSAPPPSCCSVLFEKPAAPPPAAGFFVLGAHHSASAPIGDSLNVYRFRFCVVLLPRGPVCTGVLSRFSSCSLRQRSRRSADSVPTLRAACTAQPGSCACGAHACSFRCSNDW